ncbi:hypothetical protein G6F59_017993 [Rhizopus arrhizus]|nr:hypothetical protein G6F59_017993 [Rhizopus arrhizus]
MNKTQINELASRLEGVDRMNNAERAALLRDLERYARQDLYGASRICNDHLKDKSSLRLPTVIVAAPRIFRSPDPPTSGWGRLSRTHHREYPQLRHPA